MKMTDLQTTSKSKKLDPHNVFIFLNLASKKVESKKMKGKPEKKIKKKLFINFRIFKT
jgi:hypothetical protein